MSPKCKEIFLECLSDIQDRLAHLSDAGRYNYLLRLHQNLELWGLTKSMRSFCQLAEFQEFSRFMQKEIRAAKNPR